MIVHTERVHRHDDDAYYVDKGEGCVPFVDASEVHSDDAMLSAQVIEVSIPESWRPAPPALAPVDLPTLPDLPRHEAVLTEQEQRERRIFAACRWAGVVAITEMAEGYEAALRVVTAGPEKFLPDERDWADINETARIAIAYIEKGAL